MRWLLSTIPSSMVFDDHEIVDDWNTSAAWRSGGHRSPDWWADRIGGGLVSYWVYQHLGNLSPQELDANTTWQEVLAAGRCAGTPGRCCTRWPSRADAEPGGTRWSYVRHWARRAWSWSTAGRVGCWRSSGAGCSTTLALDWVDAALARAAAEGVTHLVVGTSLPWLLPHAIDRIERVERDARRPARGPALLRPGGGGAAAGGRPGALGRRSGLLRAARPHPSAVARGEHGPPPATALVLSGDVHHGYAAELGPRRG